MLVVADAQGSLHWREIIEADENGENLKYRIQPCLVTDIQLAAAFGRLSCKLHNRIMSKELWKPSGCGRPHHYHRNHPKFNKFLKSLQNLPEHFNWDVLKKNSSLGEHSLMRARVDAAYSVMALVKQTMPPLVCNDPGSRVIPGDFLLHRDQQVLGLVCVWTYRHEQAGIRVPPFRPSDTHRRLNSR